MRGGRWCKNGCGKKVFCVEKLTDRVRCDFICCVCGAYHSKEELEPKIIKTGRPSAFQRKRIAKEKFKYDLSQLNN